MGIGTQRARMREAGFFIQDSWRWKPNFTINLGLRYDLQYPFYPLNSSYSTATLADLCGAVGRGFGDESRYEVQPLPSREPARKEPAVRQLREGRRTPTTTDYNNFAPNVGFAWTLNDKSGVLGTLLGDEAVVRGGYTRAFNRNGMNDFSGQYGGNPGVVIQNPDRDTESRQPQQ